MHFQLFQLERPRHLPWILMGSQTVQFLLREDSLLREEEADEEEKPPDPEEEVPIEARSPDATTSRRGYPSGSMWISCCPCNGEITKHWKLLGWKKHVGTPISRSFGMDYPDTPLQRARWRCCLCCQAAIFLGLFFLSVHFGTDGFITFWLTSQMFNCLTLARICNFSWEIPIHRLTSFYRIDYLGSSYPVLEHGSYSFCIDMIFAQLYFSHSFWIILSSLPICGK